MSCFTINDTVHCSIPHLRHISLSFSHTDSGRQSGQPNDMDSLTDSLIDLFSLSGLSGLSGFFHSHAQKLFKAKQDYRLDSNNPDNPDSELKCLVLPLMILFIAVFRTCAHISLSFLTQTAADSPDSPMTWNQTQCFMHSVS